MLSRCESSHRELLMLVNFLHAGYKSGSKIGYKWGLLHGAAMALKSASIRHYLPSEAPAVLQDLDAIKIQDMSREEIMAVTRGGTSGNSSSPEEGACAHEDQTRPEKVSAWEEMREKMQKLGFELQISQISGGG